MNTCTSHLAMQCAYEISAVLILLHVRFQGTLSFPRSSQPHESMSHSCYLARVPTLCGSISSNKVSLGYNFQQILIPLPKKIINPHKKYYFAMGLVDDIRVPLEGALKFLIDRNKNFDFHIYYMIYSFNEQITQIKMLKAINKKF